MGEREHDADLGGDDDGRRRHRTCGGSPTAPSPLRATDLSAYPPTFSSYAGWLDAKFTPTEISRPDDYRRDDGSR